MSVSSGSVRSIESIFSDGCPVSPSLLYEQRSVLFETRLHLRQRKAITAYRSYKTRAKVGGGAVCLNQDEINEPCIKRRTDLVNQSRHDFPRSRTFRLRDKVSNLAMISINI